MVSATLCEEPPVGASESGAGRRSVGGASFTRALASARNRAASARATRRLAIGTLRSGPPASGVTNTNVQTSVSGAPVTRPVSIFVRTMRPFRSSSSHCARVSRWGCPT